MRSRHNPTAQGRGPLRGLTFVVAWVCLAAQAMGIVHLAVVRHATCPEHGEITHAAEPPVSPAEATPAFDTAPGLKAVTLDATADSHDHCLACAVRKEAAAYRVLRPLPAVAELAPSLPVTGEAPGGARTLYRLAPKTSPPA
jgi:hypothetical protein